jgi:2'-5' RNA ligase
MRCFLGFELAEDSRAYLRPLLSATHRALVAKGWPVRLVQPDKWHATLLFFNDLGADERAAIWPEVQIAAVRGAWKDPGFHWRGLALWPRPERPSLVALESESYPALTRWGLESWLTHPVCLKGELRYLKSYRPHFTVMRLQENPTNKPALGERAEEWEQVQKQLEPIDLQRVRIDRISFFLSDFSQPYHRYIREGTVEIG